MEVSICLAVWHESLLSNELRMIFIYMCVCVSVCMYLYIYIYIYKMEFYCHKKELLPFATAWMKLEDNMLTEISQKKTNTMWFLLYIKSKLKQKHQLIGNRKLIGRTYWLFPDSGSQRGWGGEIGRKVWRGSKYF